jgi:uncharacterized protein YijF (DUF1287 family)
MQLPAYMRFANVGWMIFVLGLAIASLAQSAAPPAQPGAPGKPGFGLLGWKVGAAGKPGFGLLRWKAGQNRPSQGNPAPVPSIPGSPGPPSKTEFTRALVAAAVERPKHEITYDPGYVGITYPGGDVPANSGVCSDEIVRIYRAVGVDLQKEVHEDIVRDPSAYPLSRWQQKRPDRNIDHRRVPNLMAFFSRHGEDLPLSSHAKDYLPGDLVAWDLGNGAVHIGMVVGQKALLSGRYMIVHNIGAGPKMEDVLFDWKVIGHYRYFGPQGTVRNPAPAGSNSP